jgi:hypothetical protein
MQREKVKRNRHTERKGRQRQTVADTERERKSNESEQNDSYLFDTCINHWKHPVKFDNI